MGGARPVLVIGVDAEHEIVLRAYTPYLSRIGDDGPMFVCLDAPPFALCGTPPCPPDLEIVDAVAWLVDNAETICLIAPPADGLILARCLTGFDTLGTYEGRMLKPDDIEVTATCDLDADVQHAAALTIHLLAQRAYVMMVQKTTFDA